MRDGSLGCFSKICLEFAECHLDRIEVVRIFGEITPFRTGRFNVPRRCRGEALHQFGSGDLAERSLKSLCVRSPFVYAALDVNLRVPMFVDCTHFEFDFNDELEIL